MKKYTKQDLALIVKKIIVEKYCDPEYFYEQLKGNLKGKIRANTKQVLTDEEYKEKGLKIAESIIEDLHRIPEEALENKISTDVESEAAKGIELADYKDYLLKVAKESLREYVNAKYKYQKAQIKKSNQRKK